MGHSPWIPISLIFLITALSLAQAQNCNAGGLPGTCIDQGTTDCNGIIIPGYCPGSVICCVNDSDLPTCSTPQGDGICNLTSTCQGTYVSGYCHGPDAVMCCVNPAPAPTSWNRTQCQEIANIWLHAGVQYSWAPTAPQYITYGPGPYRTDCSGFVSAAWNVPPPGAVTYNNFPCYQIDAEDLQPCDALLNPAQHVALFMGWQNAGQPIVTEECGHTVECCGADATCPGNCGSEENCNEECPGCPAMHHAWDSIPVGFYPCRFNNW